MDDPSVWLMLRSGESGNDLDAIVWPFQVGQLAVWGSGLALGHGRDGPGCDVNQVKDEDIGCLGFSNLASATCSIPRAGYRLGPEGQQVVLSDDEAALMIVLARGSATRGELAEAVDLPSLGVRDAMNRLRRLGLVHSEGHGRGAKWIMGPG